jgi:hypothetical protein
MSRIGGHSIVLKGKVQQPRPQRSANGRGIGSLPKPRGVPPMTRSGSLIGMVHGVSASSLSWPVGRRRIDRGHLAQRRLPRPRPAIQGPQAGEYGEKARIDGEINDDLGHRVAPCTNFIGNTMTREAGQAMPPASRRQVAHCHCHCGVDSAA